MRPHGRNRAAIYCRISRDQEDTRLGVERQERICRRICRERGWTVVEVFVDNDISATDDRRRRPGFEALLAGAGRGQFDVIVAVDLDRLTRTHRGLLRLVEACTTQGVRVAFQSEAGFDPVTGDGMLEIEVRTSVAAEEIRKLRRRVQRKRRQQAEAGRPNNGPRPYGWTSAARTRFAPRERKVVREMADRLLAGASQGDIVRWTKEAKITTATGNVWTVTRVRRQMLAPGIAGLREFQDIDEEGNEVTVTVKGTWKPIITVDERERLQAILGNVRRHRSPSVYLLTGGLLECGICRTPHVGAGRRGYRRYRCAQLGTMVAQDLDGCGRTSIKAEELEEYVVDFALWWAMTPEVISARRSERKAVESEAAEVRARLADLRAKEQRLNDMRVDGDISPQEHRRKRTDLLAEREHLEAQSRRVESAEERLTAGGLEEIRRRWDDLTHNEKRAVLRSLLRKVVLRPGVRGRKTFDPDRVEIWPDWGTAYETAMTFATEGGTVEEAREQYLAALDRIEVTEAEAEEMGQEYGEAWRRAAAKQPA